MNSALILNKPDSNGSNTKRCEFRIQYNSKLLKNLTYFLVHSLKCIVCSDTMKSDPSVEGVERGAEEDNDIQRCDQFSLSKKHDFIKYVNWKRYNECGTHTFSSFHYLNRECPPKSSCIVIFSPKFVVRNCGRVEKDSCKSYSTASKKISIFVHLFFYVAMTVFRFPDVLLQSRLLQLAGKQIEWIWFRWDKQRFRKLRWKYNIDLFRCTKKPMAFQDSFVRPSGYLRGMKATSEDDEDLPDGSGDEGSEQEKNRSVLSFEWFHSDSFFSHRREWIRGCSLFYNNHGPDTDPNASAPRRVYFWRGGWFFASRW